VADDDQSNGVTNMLFIKPCRVLSLSVCKYSLNRVNTVVQKKRANFGGL